MYFKIQKGMRRVYLAKSNKANPNLVSAVRQTLTKFDVQIVEFTGGSYSNDLLLSCDELYVIPDLSEAENDEYGKSWSVSIGKGLYQQIQSFIEPKGGDNIFIVTDFDDLLGVGGIHYDDDDDNFISIKAAGGDDYITYAYVIINTKNADIAPWELYDYVLESNQLKDVSWATELVDSCLTNTPKQIVKGGIKGVGSIILRRRARR